MTSCKRLMGIFCALCMLFSICGSAFAAESYSPNNARIVGTQFDATSNAHDISLNTSASNTHIKVWVYAESGSLNASIVDKDGNTVTGGSNVTLISGSKDDSTIFWITRDDSYTGDYYLHVRGLNGSNAKGWYNCVGGTQFESLIIEAAM